MQPMVECQGCCILKYTIMSATLLQGVSFILIEFANDMIFIESFVIISLILGRDKRHCEVCVNSSDRVASTMDKGIW